ncbi:MAG: P13 family porin [Sphaerochaetaceae bacterium]|jgi:hypothetical protein|nr:P13 family porin [Sphaerochaetaceae bacterium]
MKKFLVWVLVGMFLGQASFAGNVEEASKALRKNRGADLSSYRLSEEERDWLEAKYRTKTVLPVVLDLFPGFGIGNFIQGDGKTGTTALACDVGATVMCASGVVLIFSQALVEGFSGVFSLGNANSDDVDKTMLRWGVGLSVAGLAMGVGTNIWAACRSYQYAQHQNALLARSLESAKVSLVALPAFETERGFYGVLGANIVLR